MAAFEITGWRNCSAYTNIEFQTKQNLGRIQKNEQNPTKHEAVYSGNLQPLSLLSAKFFPRHPLNIPLFWHRHIELPSTPRWQLKLLRSWISWIVRSFPLVFSSLTRDWSTTSQRPSPPSQPNPRRRRGRLGRRPRRHTRGRCCWRYVFPKSIYFVFYPALRILPRRRE